MLNTWTIIIIIVIIIIVIIIIIITRNSRGKMQKKTMSVRVNLWLRPAPAPDRRLYAL